jgi:hypothetical protein
VWWGLAVHALRRLHRRCTSVSDLDQRRELFGFFHEEMFTSAREAADIRGGMAEFAGRWNYRLAKVFTAKPGDGPEAFDALREAVRRDGAAVVVPNAAHLTPYGDIHALMAELRELSGQQVMQSEPVRFP